MRKGTLHWFAAEYHFPSTYSCRLPLSSAASALISPGPGPATVRLALIRVGIELFGHEVVREVLFPWIRSARLRVRPPERLAISEQVVRAYKATEKGKAVSVAESVVYREMAHAEGSLMLYLELPLEERDKWHLLLRSISYWGQASSFTTCLQISEDAPVENRMRPAVARGEYVYSTSAVLFLYPFRISLSFPLMARCCSTRRGWSFRANE